MALTKDLDLVGAVVAIVLGILLILNILDLELVLGVILLVVGLLALAKRM